MKTEVEDEKKIKAERMRLIERARMMIERTSAKAEQVSFDIVKLTDESSTVIDCFR